MNEYEESGRLTDEEYTERRIEKWIREKDGLEERVKSLREQLPRDRQIEYLKKAQEKLKQQLAEYNEEIAALENGGDTEEQQ